MKRMNISTSKELAQYLNNDEDTPIELPTNVNLLLFANEANEGFQECISAVGKLAQRSIHMR